MESELRTFDSNTILNYKLSKKFKLIEINKFNSLIITLIHMTQISKTQLEMKLLFLSH